MCKIIKHGKSHCQGWWVYLKETNYFELCIHAERRALQCRQNLMQSYMLIINRRKILVLGKDYLLHVLRRMSSGYLTLLEI